MQYLWRGAALPRPVLSRHTARQSGDMLARSNIGHFLLELGDQANRILDDVSQSANLGSLQAVAGISSLMVEELNKVKTNKETCTRLTEHAYEVIIVLADHWMTQESLSRPALIDSVGRLLETLQKVVSYLRKHAERRWTNRVLRQTEDTRLLNEVKAELDSMLAFFGIDFHLHTNIGLSVLEAQITQAHQTAISQIRGLKSATAIDSTSNISLLVPSTPQIFYGRDEVLETIVNSLLHDRQARHAILGLGGIGKSSLARAVLNDHRVEQRFQRQRWFVSTESATSYNNLLLTLATYFCIDTDEAKLAKAVIKHLQRKVSVDSPGLLVLDNFETPWEPIALRPAVEDLLGQITTVDSLAVLITLRGTERPGRICWTKPLLPPLQILSLCHARRVFLDISDVQHDDPDLDEVISLTGRIPLAITLMASVAERESCREILSIWKTARTSILSGGPGPQANLDISISMSVKSPRLLTTPEAFPLLTILSLLPDGLSPEALRYRNADAQGRYITPDLHKGKYALCRTALAYEDQDGRLKMLVPIREYIRSNYPPPSPCLQAIQSYFYSLASMAGDLRMTPLPEALQDIAADVGNIESIILYSVEKQENPEGTVLAALSLLAFGEHTSLAPFELVQAVRPLLDHLDSDEILGKYYYWLGYVEPTSEIRETLLRKALQHYEAGGDVCGQADTYREWATTEIRAGRLTRALSACEKSVSLSQQSGDASTISYALTQKARIQRMMGNVHGALCLAQQAQQAAQDGGNLRLQVNALDAQAECWQTIGNLAEANNLYKEAINLLKALGGWESSSPRYLRVLLSGLAESHMLKTEYEDAREILNHLASLPTRGHGTLLLQLHYASYSLCAVGVACGDFAQPQLQNHLETTLQYFTFAQDTYGEALCRLLQADILRLSGSLDESRHHYLQILPDLSRCQYYAVFSQCHQSLGRLCITASLTSTALTHFVCAFAGAMVGHESVEALKALLAIGDVFLMKHDKDTAVTLFRLCDTVFALMDVHQPRAECLTRLAKYHEERGDKSQAKACWQMAIPLFEKSCQMRDAVRCQEELSRLNDVDCCSDTI